jgi:hypothetical protein
MIPVILLRGVEAVAAGKSVASGRDLALRLLPQLEPGDILSARVEARLPDGNYKVMLAGQQMSMSLPTYVAPGDTLELAFVTREPRLTFALRDAAQAAAAPAPVLSAAGRLVAATMLQPGQPPMVTTASAAAPLLVAVPADGAALSVALEQTLAQSGLFYESHQAEWIAGRRELAQLRQEPQARLALRAPTDEAGATAVVQRAGTPAQTPAAGGSTEASNRTDSDSRGSELAQMHQEPQARSTQHAREADAATPPAAADDLRAGASVQSQEQAIHPRTVTLVQQQLAALDTARVLLQLEVWPNQWMQWVIDEHAPDAAREPTAPQSWNTRLRLDLPQLGELKAALTLGSDGVRIRLEAASAQSAALLREHRASLQAAFATAGMPPASISIDQHART